MPIQSNNHTQVPNCIMDEHMRSLTGAGLKVLLFICRKTIGWHKNNDQISQSQIIQATGLSKNGIKLAIIELSSYGLIRVNRTGNGKGIKTFFELNYDEDDYGSKIDGSKSDTIKELNGSESDTKMPFNGSESDPTKETNINKKKKKADATHADYSKTVKLFTESYQTLHGSKMSFSSKDGKHINQLLSKHPYLEIVKKIDIFRDKRKKDAWFKDKALTPGVILSQWNNLIGETQERKLKSITDYLSAEGMQ